MRGAYKFYAEISKLLIVVENCRKNKNDKWENEHADKIEELVKKYLPHGSGFDSGTVLDFSESNHNKLVFLTAYHHMNEGGYYDGWTEHKVIITPDLAFGFNVKITGRNRNDIKEYISSCFTDFEYSPEK